MTITRIDPPTWARDAEIRRDEISDYSFAELQKLREAMLSAVHAEVTAYLSDPQLTFDSIDDFPNVHRLTGEYYIGDELYWTDEKTGHHLMSIMTHCLEHPRAFQSKPSDYLGLEVWLENNPKNEIFASFRNTDSSVI